MEIPIIRNPFIPHHAVTRAIERFGCNSISKAKTLIKHSILVGKLFHCLSETTFVMLCTGNDREIFIPVKWSEEEKSYIALTVLRRDEVRNMMWYRKNFDRVEEPLVVLVE
jgi:hypothetical protein